MRREDKLTLFKRLEECDGYMIVFINKNKTFIDVNFKEDEKRCSKVGKHLIRIITSTLYNYQQFMNLVNSIKETQRKEQKDGLCKPNRRKH